MPRLLNFIKRAAGLLGSWLLVSIFAIMAIGISNSNLFYGTNDQYARVPIPGHQVIHLPAGRAEVAVAVALPGRGRGTPNLRLPKVGLDLLPKDKGGPEPIFTDDVGGSVNAGDPKGQVDTQRRVWWIDVPREGDYVAVTSGNFTGYGLNAQMWFGFEPGWLRHDLIMPLGAAIAAIIVAIGYISWLLTERRERSRRGVPD